MQKLIALIAHPTGVDRAAFQRSVRERAAAAPPAVAGLTVNVVDLEGPGRPAAPPRWDAVLELWLAEAGLDPNVLAAALAGDSAAVHLYHVVERVQLDHTRTWALGERSPGVKAIYATRRPEGLDAREAARLWREHAPLARRHHTGMSRYVQNGVIEALTPDAPVVHGFAVLHFPTLSDLEERMYDSAEGRRAIAADAARLVAEAIPLFTGEYILRVSQREAPPP
jgi:hypothetical protein